MRWKVRAWFDVPGTDPWAEAEVRIGQRPESVPAPPDALAQRSSDGAVAIAVEPLPIVAGHAFGGTIESLEPLNPAPTLTTHGRCGSASWPRRARPRVAGSVTASRGELSAGTVGTLEVPHGTASAFIDVVISRRLLPDKRYQRLVAVVASAPDA